MFPSPARWHGLETLYAHVWAEFLQFGELFAGEKVGYEIICAIDMGNLYVKPLCLKNFGGLDEDFIVERLRGVGRKHVNGIKII